MLKIYLDTCCFNRPYDDQSLLRNSLEAQAVSHIQFLIRERHFLLASSYILLFENSISPHVSRKTVIEGFIKKYSSTYIGVEHMVEIENTAQLVLESGVQSFDAYHIACAQIACCNYFLTTDDKLLKYGLKNITIANPVDFLRMEVERH